MIPFARRRWRAELLRGGIAFVATLIAGVFGEALSANQPAIAATAIREQRGNDFAWLEESHGERALNWVQNQNRRTVDALKRDRRYAGYLRSAMESAYDSSGMPSGLAMSYQGRIYDVWKDESHPRGKWRRTTLESFRSTNPKWEELLDVDAISAKDGKSYWFSPSTLWFGSRCMVIFSDGGGATSMVWREFDLESRSFTVDGFTLPIAKSTSAAWFDERTLLVATDFGANTVSGGGFPLVVKSWTRGHALSDAKEIFKGAGDKDASVEVGSITDGRGKNLVFIKETSLQDTATYWRLDEGPVLRRMTLPPRAFVFHQGLIDGELIFSPQDDWTLGGKTWRADSVLSMPLADVTQTTPRVRLLMEPTDPRETIEDIQVSRSGVLVNSSLNVRGRVYRFQLSGDKWTRSLVPLPDHGSIHTAIIGNSMADTVFVTYESFLHPTSLYEIHVSENRVEKLRSLTPQFDADELVTEQLEATSTDGTKIPYFVVRSKSLKFDGDAPTLLHGYGAYGLSQYPAYDGLLGKLWLTKGGVYALANIRGGEEFGSKWHVRGLERRHTYEDFEAVARDLISRKITSASKLGISGASAGGLLVGVAITQSPELFRAAILEVPYLDQFRPDMTRSGANRAQIEFGSTELGAERDFLERTSPYQNLHKTLRLPDPFIISSTTDDTVRPGQPRRFAAKMEKLGLPFFYYETSEGGHGAAATPAERAKLEAMEYTYLAQRLLDGSGNAKSATDAVAP